MNVKWMIGLFVGIALSAVSCSDPIDVHTREMDRTYLIVEGLLTDNPVLGQYVKLSESTPYFSDEGVIHVSGAEVVVSDGEREILFSEGEEGEYRPPEGFRAEIGKTYRLSVKASVAGELHQFHAEETMPALGFTLDKIDYYYNAPKIDSLWTVVMWGKDDFASSSTFVAYISLNGNRSPLSTSLMIEDKYFNGKNIEAFPVGLLAQTADNRKQYGDCAKFIEEGDVLALEGYSMTTPYYRFLSGLQNDGGMSMPFLSSQPANPPTNISGDGDALGYFAVCSTATASVTVTDPFKTLESVQGD